MDAAAGADLLGAAGAGAGASLRLHSCYAQPIPQAPEAAGEPAFTTYHGGCHATVDYIWHDAALRCAAVLEMQAKGELDRYRGLPTNVWSSDHMSLVADLCFAEPVAVKAEAVTMTIS